MKWLSLFSGIGGFDLALTRKGHQIIGACEIDGHARSIYAKHFPNVRIYEDATKINPEELPDFDGICAGFPCQAFSIAGKRLGFEESRGTLFFEIARIAKQKRPRFLLLENVKGLINHDGGKTFANILATLDELGYNAEWQVLNSKYFVPQNRERIFIIAYLRGTSRPEVFPVRESSEITHDGDSEKQIAATLQTPGHAAGNYRGMNMIAEPELKQVGNIDQKGHNSIWGRVYDPEGISSTIAAEGGGLGAKTGLYAWSSSGRDWGREERLKKDEANTLSTGKGCKSQSTANFVIKKVGKMTEHNGSTVYDPEGIAPTLKASSGSGNKTKITTEFKPLTEARSDHAKEMRKQIKKETGKDYVERRDKDIVERKDGNIGTLTASSSIERCLSNGTAIRRLTPKECERLQGFPDDWTAGLSDTQRYKCCGNAVTVNVIEFILDRLS